MAGEKAAPRSPGSLETGNQEDLKGGATGQLRASLSLSPSPEVSKMSLALIQGARPGHLLESPGEL